MRNIDQVTIKKDPFKCVNAMTVETLVKFLLNTIITNLNYQL